MNAENATDAADLLNKAFLSFSWMDYALFILMFGLSTIIGIYYGCCGNKQATTEDYLHGGKKMSVFPVAMSLTASNLSGISLLGIPAEVYVNGTQYSVCTISIIILILIISNTYLPVFYKLQLNSTYEYLERRFSKKIRLMASALFIITTILYIPIVIYVPALAFNQVTGIDLYLITPIISFICIFYTTIGGLKAVVWTDTLQFTVTLLTLAFVMIMGTISMGGFAPIWEKSVLGDRLEFFTLSPDPTLRASFWSVLIGQTVMWMCSVGCNPATVQRFMAISTLKGAKQSLIFFAVGTIVTKFIMCFSGLIMFAKYYDCDPWTSGAIKKSDQILPYYVLDVASKIPGISGLFVAGVFSTAFSTLSTFLNTLSGIIYTDFIAPSMAVGISEAKASNIMKVNVVVVGAICVGLVFVVEKLGAVLELNITISGMTLGPLLGLFTLGMMFPMANETGAIWGSFCSLIIVGWIIIKNQLLIYSGDIKHLPKPLHTHGCEVDFDMTNLTQPMTSTTSHPPSFVEDEPFWLFNISFYYYTLIGTALAIVIALPISWFTQQPNKSPLDPDLFFPFVQRFVEKSSKTTKYTTVDNGIRVIATKEDESKL